MPKTDTDRILGSLEEFKRWSERELSELRREVTELRTEVKLLNHFKWKVVGGTSAVSTLLVGAFEFLKSTNHLPWKN
jgi:reverse gyrase